MGDVVVAQVDIKTFFDNIMAQELELPDGTVEPYAFPLEYGRFTTLSGELFDGPDIKIWGSFFPSMGWGSNSMCDQPEKALFWDDVHPSARTHCWIAYAWHLAISKTGKWTAPDADSYKAMCGSTLPWNGHIVKPADWPNPFEPQQ